MGSSVENEGSDGNNEHPYMNRNFMDTRFRGTKYFDLSMLVNQVGQSAKAN